MFCPVDSSKSLKKPVLGSKKEQRTKCEDNEERAFVRTGSAIKRLEVAKSQMVSQWERLTKALSVLSGERVIPLTLLRGNRHLPKGLPPSSNTLTISPKEKREAWSG